MIGPRVWLSSPRADARQQQRQGRCELAHARDLGREGRAHHEAELAVVVPVVVGQPCDVFIEQVAACQALRLQVCAAEV
jgi:hypothetical protein